MAGTARLYRWLAVLLMVLCATRVLAASVADQYPQVRGFFPQADRFGELTGEPRAASIHSGDRLLGYAFLTSDVLQIPAYSGKPINTLVGFDLTGRITGISIVHHEEPILAVGVTEQRLAAFTDQYRDKNVFERIAIGGSRPGHTSIDTIAGATITVMVQNQVVMSAARRVAESRGLQPGGRPPAAAGTTPTGTVGGAKPGATLGAGADPADEPVWKLVWRERQFRTAVLVIGLGLLTVILVIQDWLARHPAALATLRRAFLIYTIVFIGWYGLAQLSVVQVLTFVNAVMHEFRWEMFLIDPMLFILWGFVAVALLLWGRGVYCGWLCPYGAVQELIQQASKRLRIRQFEFPDVVHERLWAVKYVLLLLLFAVSLQSMGDAVRYAEVEPFKTAFTLRFDRDWPFVLYAGGLLVVSAFNRKFYCKYLCTLGAALAIPTRLRVFDWWLRRRKECGHPCQTCANDCEVRAIRPTGEINANECHYCLDCQVTYYSDRKCAPLIEHRLRRERAGKARMAVRAMGPGTGVRAGRTPPPGA